MIYNVYPICVVGILLCCCYWLDYLYVDKLPSLSELNTQTCFSISLDKGKNKENFLVFVFVSSLFIWFPGGWWLLSLDVLYN